MKVIFILILVSFASSSCASLSVVNTDSQSSLLMGKKIESPVFSPDGNEIVFSLHSETGRSLYKVNIDGTNLTMLSKQGAYDTNPIYSSDGKTILFSSMSDGKQADICLMKSDGSDKVCLTAGQDHDFNPIFSPDGARIYFVRAKFFGNYSPIALPSWHDNDVYSINVDGTGLTRITHKGFYRLVNLSIHPDGTKLLARVTTEDKSHSMWIISLDDTNRLEPVEPILDEYKTTVPLLSMTSIQSDKLFDPMFSPDGKSLLFTWEGHYPRTASSEVFIMDLETRRAKRITSLGMLIWGEPSFSHDGKLVVFATLRTDPLLRCIPSLWIVNKDGSDLRAVNLAKIQ